MEAILSPLQNADGSCEIKYPPHSKVLCGVTGPGDISSSKRIFDRANLLFSINRLRQKKNEDQITVVKTAFAQQHSTASTSSDLFISDRFINSIVEAALNVAAYPRTCIQICTQELEVDEPTDAAQLNGICLALLDSGIRMNYVFAAVTLALIEVEAGEAEYVDPDQIQANASKAIFTFVFRPSTYVAGALLGAHSTGQFTMEQYKKALELAERRCLPVFDFYRREMQKKFIYHISIA